MNRSDRRLQVSVANGGHFFFYWQNTKTFHIKHIICLNGSNLGLELALDCAKMIDKQV